MVGMHTGYSASVSEHISLTFTSRILVLPDIDGFAHNSYSVCILSVRADILNKLKKKFILARLLPSHVNKLFLSKDAF